MDDRVGCCGFLSCVHAGSTISAVAAVAVEGTDEAFTGGATSVVASVTTDPGSVNVSSAIGASSRGSVLPALTEDVQTKYKAGPRLGQGAYGVVMMVVDRQSATARACKVVYVDRLLATSDGHNAVSRLRNEVGIMNYLAGHPNIIRLVDVFESEVAIFIVQEICTGGTLGQLRIPLSEHRAALLFRGIIKSVMHCHQRGVLHRDVKLDNFMLSDDSPEAIVKLGDFGFAHFLRRDQRMNEAVGSPYFMAPETLRRAGYGFESDVWSCGVCLYRLLCGEFPFKGARSEDVFAALRRPDAVELSEPIWRNVTPDARDLVKALLVKDPTKRLRISDVLSHPWMQRLARGSFSGGLPMDQPTASARVFNAPTEAALRARMDGFVERFKVGVEQPYIALLAAPSAATAAVEWRTLCAGLAELDAFMTTFDGDGDSPFALGGDAPSLAEATTSPSLYRMNATLPAVRELDILLACAEIGAMRVHRWIAHVLANPGECCDVAELPSDLYVHLARRLFVTYLGPPLKD